MKCEICNNIYLDNGLCYPQHDYCHNCNKNIAMAIHHKYPIIFKDTVIELLKDIIKNSVVKKKVEDAIKS